MTLPKELTTVTLLSKYLTMALFILLPTIAFFLGMQYPSSSESVRKQPILSATVQPQVLTPSPTETQSALPVEIMTEKDAYTRNGNIKVTITNGTNNVLAVGQMCAPPIDFTVEKLSNGTWQQYRDPLPCRLVAMPQGRIKPGETIDASTTAPDEPGVYRLVLGLTDTELTGKVAYSNTFSVKVKEADAYTSDQSMMGTWKLVAYKNLITGEIEHEPDTITRSIIIEFQDNGKRGTMKGSTVANTVSGEYELSENSKIKTLNFGGTKIGEPPWGNKFWKAIYELSSYDVKGESLLLYFSDNKELMELVKK